MKKLSEIFSQAPPKVKIRDGEKENHHRESKKYKAARRKLIIEDIEKIIGKTGIWRWFAFPIYIPTEWIEEWKQGLILKEGREKEKRDYLFELIMQCRK